MEDINLVDLMPDIRKQYPASWDTEEGLEEHNTNGTPYLPFSYTQFLMNIKNDNWKLYHAPAHDYSSTVLKLVGGKKVNNWQTFYQTLPILIIVALIITSIVVSNYWLLLCILIVPFCMFSYNFIYFKFLPYLLFWGGVVLFWRGHFDYGVIAMTAHLSYYGVANTKRVFNGTILKAPLVSAHALELLGRAGYVKLYDENNTKINLY